MSKTRRILPLTALCILLLATAAGAVTESKTGVEYPDAVTVEGQDLSVTGCGLREKTFMKVDVYTIVSYADAAADLGDDPANALVEQDIAKRIQMNLRRGFSREKLVNSFSEVIDKNYDDTSAFDADRETFLAYFDRDAQENDTLVFDYAPGRGLRTVLNGEVKGTIMNPVMAQALWTVWFGAKPADKGLRSALVSAVD